MTVSGTSISFDTPIVFNTGQLKICHRYLTPLLVKYNTYQDGSNYPMATVYYWVLSGYTTDYSYGMAVDSSDNVYVVGDYTW